MAIDGDGSEATEEPIERFQGFLIFVDDAGRYHWIGSGHERDTVEEVRVEIAAYRAAAMGEA